MAESGKLKVLIVDDDKFITGMYAKKFTAEGYDVKTVNEPREAVSRLKEGFAADIVVVDVIMPVMSGPELIDRIKKENLAPRAIFVVLTNQNAPEDIERAKRAGASGYIVKAAAIPSEVVTEVRKVYEENKSKVQ